LKIYFFVNKGINSATARFRGYLIAKELKKNFKTKIYRVPEVYNRYVFNFYRIKNLIKFFNIIRNINKNDIIYLVKTVYSIDFLIIIIFAKIFLNKKIIFDFDDAIYLKKFTKISTLILTKISNIVIVGSDVLYIWAQNKNENTFKLPTSVPHKLYAKKNISKKKNIFTVGWIGNGSNHAKNLKVLKPVFEKLIIKNFKFSFKLVGLAKNKEILKFFNSINKLNFTYKNQIKWSNVASTVSELNTFDIGVMPLIKDEKTLGKCSFKIIEYMAAGVPVIASPVGENSKVIENYKDGFLAKNVNDWVKKILILNKNVKLKNEMTKKALNKVKVKYSIESNIKILNKIFTKLQW
jgi:glycosyltransferase involved in cell wall biosynthesis